MAMVTSPCAHKIEIHELCICELNRDEKKMKIF